MPLMMTPTTRCTLIFGFSTLFYTRNILILFSVDRWLYQTPQFSLSRSEFVKKSRICSHAATDNDWYNWVHHHFWIQHPFYPRNIYILVLCWLYQTLKYSRTKSAWLKIFGTCCHILPRCRWWWPLQPGTPSFLDSAHFFTLETYYSCSLLTVDCIKHYSFN